jgi:hypothetical protein
MGLQKITFEGGNVTSKIDSDLYHFLFSSDVGVMAMFQYMDESSMLKIRQRLV